MFISRRGALRFASAAVAAALPWASAADTWPSRPIRLVVPFSAGGSIDLRQFGPERGGLAAAQASLRRAEGLSSGLQREIRQWQPVVTKNNIKL